MSKKHTIEFVRESFEKDGYECLSKEYINAHQKLDYICPEGHNRSVTWNSWQQGSRCLICSGNKKHTIGFIRKEFEKEGWVCTSTEYVDAHSNLNYICSNGHIGSISWTAWQRGQRCPVCAGVKKHTIKFIKLEFEKEGWLCTSTEYINARSNLSYVCSNGHNGTITWSNWKKGYRCLACSGNKKHTIGFIKSEFEKKGWACLSDKYINAHSKLEYICPEGHRGSAAWTDWQQGKGCPKCNTNGTSIWEGLIKQFVSTINENFIENDRTQIINLKTQRYLEFDLWFPNLNKAIECNGVYWHSKDRCKALDKLKQEWCKDNNISLLIVTDTDWNKDIKKCQKKIQNFLN